MEEFLDTLGRSEGPAAYALLALCAALEYVFPPFPGDTVTLFGAFLVTASGWSLFWVVMSVTVGSLVGASAVYWFGRALARGPGDSNSWWGRYWRRTVVRTEPAAARLRERGPAFLIANRFVPGLRAFFFIAAGRAHLSFPAVLFYAGLSAVLWNFLVVGLGVGLGASWPRLLALARLYSVGVWLLLVLVALGLSGRWWWRRRGNNS
jgi:membrane protein DedA with SNARE-associated domain